MPEDQNTSWPTITHTCADGSQLTFSLINGFLVIVHHHGEDVLADLTLTVGESHILADFLAQQEERSDITAIKCPSCGAMISDLRDHPCLQEVR
jgi:hypothetical protein